MDKLTITVLMPCLNEAETLAICIRSARAAIASSGLTGEVLIADNGSTDGSQQIACREGARVIDVTRRGYGAALQAGIEAAQGKYILMGDADNSYDFSHLDRFVQALDAGADLVMGNRFLGGIQSGAMPVHHRYFGNPVLSMVGRVLFKVPAGDLHCGLRAFRKDSIQSLNLQATGMEFASEMAVKASLMGLRIDEVPTTLSPDGRSRPPHLRSWHDGWRHLRLLLLYSPRWLFLYPGMGAAVTGFVITLCLLPGDLRLGGLSFGVDTLTYAIGLMLIGVHICVFALCAKIYGMNEGLLPEDPVFSRRLRYFKMETGILAGMILLLAGAISMGYSIELWHRAAFGALDATHMLRITLPAAAMLMLGVETVFSSLFLGVLGMIRRQNTDSSRESSKQS